MSHPRPLVRRVLAIAGHQRLLKRKKDSETAIQELTTKLELVLKEEWELNNKMSRLKLRQIPCQKPQWKFTQKNGKLSRSGSANKGIDWWRYQQTILILLMFPFAKECLQTRPNTIVQEDKAPAHNHYFNNKLMIFIRSLGFFGAVILLILMLLKLLGHG